MCGSVEWLIERCAVALGTALTSLAGSISVFLPEWGIVAHQRRSGVSVVAYFVARNVVDGLVSSFVPPAIFVSLFYYIMRPTMSFGMMYLLVVACQFSVIGLGYFASLAVQSAPFLCGSVLVLIATAFSGVNPTLKKLHSIAVVGVLTNLSFARWAAEGYYLLEVSALGKVYDIESGIKFLDYGGDTVVKPFVWLVGLGVGFRVLALCVYAVPAVKMMVERRRQRSAAAVAQEASKWTKERVCRVTAVVGAMLLAALTALAIVASVTNFA